MLGQHVQLVLATVALLGAALRAASLAAPFGLARGLATVTLAAAAAVVSALALGLVGLGGDAIALTLLAVGAWLAARRLLPTPARGVLDELSDAWRGLGLSGRALAAGLAGASVAYAYWLVRHPSLGEDAIVYHLTEIVNWVRNGQPGSIAPVTYEFPVGSYPVTTEVQLAWATAISHGLAAQLLWGPASLAIAAAAGWLGLRELRVPRPAAALAVAAVCTLPVVVDQLRGPGTDVPALAWLLTAAALVVAARRRPALVYVAIVAAALSVGTKTTTLPFALVALAPALALRRSLRWRPLAVSLAAAGAVGGFWYLRNLVDHGSPFWPFVSTPWGDPVAPYLDRFQASLLERPRATLGGHVDDYLDFLGAGPLLLVAALVVALLSRRRAVLLAAAVTLLGALLWASSPSTGNAGVHPELDLALATSRYLLPVFATAALCLALAAREGGRAAVVATLALVAVVVWNVVRDAGMGFPRAPSPWPLAAAAVLAALAIAVGEWIWRRSSRAGSSGSKPASGPRMAAAALTAALAVGTLATAATGFDERFGQVPGFAGPLVAWATHQPDFERGDLTIAFAPSPVGPLSGSEVQNELELIPADARCAEVERRARTGWVVIRERRLARLLTPFSAARCLRGMRPLFDDGYAFRVYGRGPADRR